MSACRSSSWNPYLLGVEKSRETPIRHRFSPASRRRQDIYCHSTHQRDLYVSSRRTTDITRRLVLSVALVTVSCAENVRPADAAEVVIPVDDDRVDKNQDVTNDYISKLLEKSERLRDERREERLQHYYKKNFSEYFDYTGQVSDALQGEIDQWKARAESIK